MARKKQPKLYTAKNDSFAFNTEFDSDSLIKSIERFGKLITDETLRPAAYAISTVLYDEIRIRAPEKTGGLRDSVYRYRDVNLSQDSIEIWSVGINKVKAPHFHLVEYGYLQPYVTYKGTDGNIYTDKTRRLKVPKFIPPNPFFRPAYDAKINIALKVGLDTLKIKIQELV